MDSLGDKMAGVTRLELAASGVTGRRSNQLSYTPLCIFIRPVRGFAGPGASYAPLHECQ